MPTTAHTPAPFSFPSSSRIVKDGSLQDNCPTRFSTQMSSAPILPSRRCREPVWAAQLSGPTGGPHVQRPLTHSIDTYGEQCNSASARSGAEAAEAAAAERPTAPRSARCLRAARRSCARIHSQERHPDAGRPAPGPRLAHSLRRAARTMATLEKRPSFSELQSLACTSLTLGAAFGGGEALPVRSAFRIANQRPGRSARGDGGRERRAARAGAAEQRRRPRADGRHPGPEGSGAAEQWRVLREHVGELEAGRAAARAADADERGAAGEEVRARLAPSRRRKTEVS